MITSRRKLCFVWIFVGILLVGSFAFLYTLRSGRRGAFDWVPRAKESKLMIAIKNGAPPEEIRSLLENEPQLVDVKVEATGTGPAFYAASRGDIEVMKILIEFGADINQSTDRIDYKSSRIPVIEVNEYSPIHQAVFKGNLEMVKFLVEHGADWRRLYITKPPLELAREKGYTEIVEYLESLEKTDDEEPK